MRLLNVSTVQVEDKDDDTPYAILSHRWKDGEEISYRDIVNGMTEALIEKKRSGFDKINAACRQARRDGSDYIWIDTCCIDKTSSAELSEQINSMYRYYQNAQRCYAFLYGLPRDTDAYRDRAFAVHPWFERGWTLQELIAPPEVIFFTDGVAAPAGESVNEWAYLGRKSQMCERLSSITGIDAAVLSQEVDARFTSIAKRMSWAANRKTSRLEDTAYCLMGLFDVNMPMIYGEGDKAFIRLQEEIMKESNDESLFAWKSDNAPSDSRTGLLATSPAMFRDSGNFFDYIDWEPRDPFSKTNRGLQITLPLRFVKDNLYVASLNCPRPLGTDGFAGIYLEKLVDIGIPDQLRHHEAYARVDSGKILGIRNAADRGSPTTIYVRQSARHDHPIAFYPEHIVQLHEGPDPELEYRLHGTMGRSHGQVQGMTLKTKSWAWIPKGLDSVFEVTKKRHDLAAVVVFARRDESRFTVLIGSASDFGDVASQVIDGCDESRSFGQWERMFAPQPSGSRINLGPEYVTVDVVSRVVASRKYFLVSFHVEEIPTIIDEMVDFLYDVPERGIVDPLADAIRGRTVPYAQKATSKRRLGLKNMFKSSER